MSGAVVVTAGPVLSKKAQTQALEQQAAPSSGMLRTMPHGAYECALPGDAGGKAYRVVAEEGFRISTASRYSVNGDTGTYILRGDKLTFTAGPKNGEKFDRVGENQLRKVKLDGTKSELLCIRLPDRRQ